MDMRKPLVSRIRVLLATLVVGGVTLVSAPGAQALSCVQPDVVIQDADRVFVGTVDSVDGDQLTFAVTQDRGPVPVPDEVTVRLTLEEWWMAGGPRDSHEPWLVALFPGTTDIGPCNAWTEDDPEYGYPADSALAPLGEESPSASAVPNEAWNAETNPDMARLAEQQAARDAEAGATRHSAGTLAAAAAGGVTVGGVALGVIGLRRRTRRSFG